MTAAEAGLAGPPPDCALCPRLVAFRSEQRLAHPDWHNAPVPSFGDPTPWLLVVGLAPGRRGANRTGRPFTGDYAGDALYPAMLRLGLAIGHYAADAGDGLRLNGVRITNAVRCVPPQNKPTGSEMKTCRPFLAEEIAALPSLTAIVALGRIAHDAVLRTHGLPLSAARFGHGAVANLPEGRSLIDSYHCSRYNINTGRLTEAMLDEVLRKALSYRPPGR